MKRATVFALAVLTLATLVTAASAASTPKPALPFKLPEGAKTQTTPSGLQYVDLVVGKGTGPVPGDLCIVHYTAWREDGTEIDTSKKPRPRDPRDPSKGEKVLPFGFKVGAGQVIPGWDEGVLTMHEGGKRLLFIPPQLGYGAKGMGKVVPPDTRLMFEVELIKVKREPLPTPVLVPAVPPQ